MPAGQAESFLSNSHNYFNSAVVLEQEKINNNFKFEKLKIEKTKLEIELAKLELLKEKNKIDAPPTFEGTSETSGDIVMTGTRNEVLDILRKLKERNNNEG